MVGKVMRLRQTPLTCQVLALRMQMHHLACQQVERRQQLRGQLRDPHLHQMRLLRSLTRRTLCLPRMQWMGLRLNQPACKMLKQTLRKQPNQVSRVKRPLIHLLKEFVPLRCLTVPLRMRAVDVNHLLGTSSLHLWTLAQSQRAQSTTPLR